MMVRSLRTAVRFLSIVAIFAAVVYVAAPVSPPGSPYGSALSILAVGAAHANPPCENTICNVLRNPPTCTARQNGMKCKVTGQGCQNSSC